MRTLLICHADDTLNFQALPRWLASFTELVGVVALSETKQRLWKRIRREVKRVGWLRFPDVLAFRFYYKLFLQKSDRAWEEAKLAELLSRYPPLKPDTPVLEIHSPNAPKAEEFIRRQAPDLVIARCKSLLKESVFSIPKCGTFVMHPGICPQYRNAHGCFWALAMNDRQNVGMTLLRIDKGVDTGPTFGYFHYTGDDAEESHIVIQHRVVFDNLLAIGEKLLEIHSGTAVPIDTTGKPSGTWGQPWLSAYRCWKKHARRRC